MSATVDASHRLQRSGLILIILWGLIGDLTSNLRFDVKLVIRRQIGDSTSNCDLTSNVAIKRPCSWVEVRSRCEVSTAADMGTPVHFFPEQNSLILCASRTSVGRSCKNEVWQAADSHINLFVKKNQ